MNGGLSLTQAAAALGVHRRTLLRWVYAGRISYRKIGGRYSFTLDQIDDYVRRNTHEASA